MEAQPVAELAEPVLTPALGVLAIRGDRARVKWAVAIDVYVPGTICTGTSELPGNVAVGLELCRVV